MTRQFVTQLHDFHCKGTERKTKLQNHSETCRGPKNNPHYSSSMSIIKQAGTQEVRPYNWIYCNRAPRVQRARLLKQRPWNSKRS